MYEECVGLILFIYIYIYLFIYLIFKKIQAKLFDIYKQIHEIETCQKPINKKGTEWYCFFWRCAGTVEA